MSEKIIQISNVSFQYENSEKGALHDVSLTVEPGECILLCGESGCGKTTITRLLNGLIPHFYEGTLNGMEEVCGLKIQEEELYTIAEKVGSVFQNPRSQFFCLDTTSEVAFGCENMGLPEDEIKQRIAKVTRELKMENLMGRNIFKLSGGEKQRIAIARAIVNEPKVLLLDEPLGALDLKMRQDMQYELIRLKNELGITFLYVTHDQEEALTISDTIVVMNQGYIQQIGTPEKIYNEPENAFVADFIGESNIISATMVEDRLVKILGVNFACVDEGFGQNQPVDVVIRPEDIDLLKPGEGSIDGVVTHMIFKGVHYEMEVMANNYEWLIHSTDMFPVGTEVSIHVDPFDIQIMKKPESEDEEAVNIEE